MLLRLSVVCCTAVGWLGSPSLALSFLSCFDTFILLDVLAAFLRCLGPSAGFLTVKAIGGKKKSTFDTYCICQATIIPSLKMIVDETNQTDYLGSVLVYTPA